MSLINKMLQDLDARNASAIERAGLSPHLRALPPKRSYPWRSLTLAAVGALVGAVLVWLIIGTEPPPPPPAPAAMPIPAAVEATPPAPAMPALVVPLPAEPADQARVPPAAAAPVKPVPAAKLSPTIGRGLGIDVSLRVDDRLDTAPAPAPASPARALPAAPSGPASIDKQPRTSRATEAADTEYRKALLSLRNGQVAEGITGLRSALRLDPRFALARQALLSAQVEQQLWQEAQATAAEGLALDPAQSGWAMILARLQVERGEMAQATETLGQYAAHAERNADYQAFYALLLHKQQRSKEAAQRYQAALALRPAESRWWYGLGLALEADQRPQEARDAFAHARDAGNLPREMAAAVEQKLR